MLREKIAIIDIGSNTIRLVIYGIDSDYYFTELQNIKTPARLSQYLVEETPGQKRMKQAGIDLLLKTLEDYAFISQHAQVKHLKAFATAAIRQSLNQIDIVQQVKQQTGIDITILSEAEEATYGQYAVCHAMNHPHAITVDLGGGSCEVTLFKDKKMQAYHSLPFGAVSLKQQFFQDKAANDPTALEQVKDYVHQAFKELAWLKKARLPIIALGGSARNLANVHQQLAQYPMGGIHDYTMNRDQVLQTYQTFLDCDPQKLTDIDGLSSDRSDIITAATLVFIELLRVVDGQAFIFSNQGLREGLMIAHINQTYHYPIDAHLVQARSIARLGQQMQLVQADCLTRVNHSLKLYQALIHLNLLEADVIAQSLLEYSSYLYLMGDFIESEADSQHTFYLLTNMNLFGFTHRERLMLALLASYRNKTQYDTYLQKYPNWLDSPTSKALQKLGGLLKFTHALNHSKTRPIQHLELIPPKDDSDTYILNLYHHIPVVAETYRTQRQKKHLERLLNAPVQINFIKCNSI